MRACALALCVWVIVVAPQVCWAQEAVPLDAAAVLQEMSARMLALDSFHQRGQLSTTIMMGDLTQPPMVWQLETWYQKPNKLATRWANTQMIFDGTYGYFYAEGSPVAYRWPAENLPAGWEWASQPTGGMAGPAPGYYPPEVMQWLRENARAYQTSEEIHVIFTLTGEQMMRLMGAMGGEPLAASEDEFGFAQAMGQMLAMMEMRWDMVLDPSTYLVRHMRGQLGMPTFGVSTDFLLQFPLRECNVPVPEGTFVLVVPPEVRIEEGVPPLLAPGLSGLPAPTQGKGLPGGVQ